MRIGKSHIIRAAVSAIIACILAFLMLKILGIGLTGTFTGFDDNYYLSCFYNLYNKNSKSVQESNDIVVFDIADYSSRTDISNVINKIASFKPSVICLDVFMPRNVELDQDADNRIVDALSGVECTVVSPCILDEVNDEWEYPFYKDKLDTPDYIYASPVSFDLFEQYSENDPRNAMKTTAFSVAEAFTRVYGLELNETNGCAINFRNKEFIPYSDLDEIEESDIKGKIVLIGDCKDYKDTRILPCRVKDSYNMPGVILIGYTVNTLISSSDYCKSNGYNFIRSAYNRPFKKCRAVTNLALSYTLCFLLSLLMLLFADREFEGAGKLRRIGVIFLSFFSVMVAEILMVMICFAIFTSLFLRIPDILLFLISMLFVDTAIKIVEVFNDNTSYYLDI